MQIYDKITDLIGKTPLLELKNFEQENNIEAKIIAKLESFNPAGSAKDRVALAMIDDAEQNGLINKNTVIIEPTSGNTGIGLAMVAASRGYRVIFTMPDSMSIERRNLLKAYGAELVLTPANEGMQGAVEKANQLSREIENSFIPSQFTNMANPKSHFDTTGPEIWDDTNGMVDIFVACVGTGGTLSGVGEYLKSKKPQIKVVAVEPATSPLLSKGIAAPHKIQGIGANFVPETLNKEIYDEVITVSDENAMETGKYLAQNEGLLVGISSGAAVCAAKELAQRDENKDKMIVVLLPDTGERYLSSEMFSE
ncbi:cysteine synthase A [bacterium]|nr:cysteine synthase A [bacterium]